MPKSKIKGVGFYVPDNVIKNSDLEEIMDTSDEWIQERTGIKERRWVEGDLTTSLMGTYASKIAIKNAKISTETQYKAHLLNFTSFRNEKFINDKIDSSPILNVKYGPLI